MATTNGELPSRSQLWYGFIAGMAWLALIATIFANLADYPFAVTYAATICAALFASGLALAWLYRWAANKEAQRRQFELRSLFFLITFAAMYLATIRWVVGHIERQAGEQMPLWAMVLVSAAGAIFAALTVPFCLLVTEALLWFGVWLVRWPGARPAWRRLLRKHPRRACSHEIAE